MPEVMYHLYAGSSEDGRGHPRYVGRTTNKEHAQRHLDKLRADPYSFGHVLWFDEKQEHHIHPGYPL